MQDIKLSLLLPNPVRDIRFIEIAEQPIETEIEDGALQQPAITETIPQLPLLSTINNYWDIWLYYT